MTAKKSFLIILRLVFILFTLLFIKDAFFKWDGYSYYMRFIEFLPDLSLSFILWTIPVIFIAFALWLVIYGLYKISPKSLIPIRLEHIMGWFLIVGLLMIIKRTFFSHVSLSGVFGVSHSVTLIIGGALVAVVVWSVRRYIEKLLAGLDSRLTPLVWLFTGLLILAVPVSMFETVKSHLTKESTHVTSQKVGDESHSNSSLGIESQRRVDHPNIILVTMDALTALDMQVYGYERPTTPFITEWAKDAIVFNRAYASANWTPPGTMSLMTGQRPWTHRVWYRAIYSPVNNYMNNLPKVLRENGYAVYGFIQNNYAHPETLGIKDAFMTKDKSHTFWIRSKWWFDKLSMIFINKPVVKEWIFSGNNPVAKLIISSYPHSDVYTTFLPSEMVYNRFLEYISQIQNEKSQQPFFTWLHVWPPHNPYLPPEPYTGMFGDSERFNSDKKQDSYFEFGAEYNPKMQADIDILRKRYDEFVLYSDQQFKLFISRLSEIIDMSNTIIILSSDHGESFLHSYLAHNGPHLYESIVHVPLIIKMSKQKEGRAIDIPVEQIDIAPTILELTGIRIPEWMEGQSLLPLIKAKVLKSRPIISMQLIKNHVIGNPLITKGTIAVWEGDYKLIYYLEDDIKLLFNLNTDPGETQNIFKEEPEIGQRLKKLIEDELDKANKRIKRSS